MAKHTASDSDIDPDIDCGLDGQSKSQSKTVRMSLRTTSPLVSTSSLFIYQLVAQRTPLPRCVTPNGPGPLQFGHCDGLCWLA